MAHKKGPGPAQKHDGSPLRIAIVHARWNSGIIEPLVSGARSALLSSGVEEQNIITESVPGSYELPFACQRAIAASQLEASSLSNMAGGAVGGLMSATHDLLGGSTSDLQTTAQQQQQEQQAVGLSGKPEGSGDDGGPQKATTLAQPFDAVIAIGVLIKGQTMHFEYIADAVSHGLMRVQLDTGIPVVFGLLTVLHQEQARARAGVVKGEHNHGEDWGNAAVELGAKKRRWGEGRLM